MPAMTLRPTPSLRSRPSARQGLAARSCLALLTALGACQSPPPGQKQGAPPQAATPTPSADPSARAAPPPQIIPESPAQAEAKLAAAPAPASATMARTAPKPSEASNAKAYRADAAAHLYQLNKHRIYTGRLPPNLYAIGVLDVDLNSRGQVLALKWQRAPRHAPEVIQEIERTVREAAPYPMLSRMRQVTYTDVWLWHKSGSFQLDTLTEGQD
jgi:protein TonB